MGTQKSKICNSQHQLHANQSLLPRLLHSQVNLCGARSVSTTGTTRQLVHRTEPRLQPMRGQLQLFTLPDTWSFDRSLGRLSVPFSSTLFVQTGTVSTSVMFASQHWDTRVATALAHGIRRFLPGRLSKPSRSRWLRSRSRWQSSRPSTWLGSRLSKDPCLH